MTLHQDSQHTILLANGGSVQCDLVGDPGASTNVQVTFSRHDDPFTDNIFMVMTKAEFKSWLKQLLRFDESNV